MRKQLMSSVATFAITAVIGGTSLAADLPVRKAPPPAAVSLVNWSGFYIGGHLGYGQGTFDSISHQDQFVQNLPSGIVGGMHVGQNWQVNTFVYGWEADLSATGWNDHRAFPTPPGDSGRTMNTTVNLLASLRGRLGLTFDRTLLYVTGGLAWTQAKFLQTSPGGTQWGATINKFGGVVGLGAEWKQTQNFSWRLEGLWYIFNAEKIAFGHHGEFGTTELKNAFVVRLGATHHF